MTRGALQTAVPYSSDYDETVVRGEQENRDGVHPPLSSKVQNMDSYDVIFLGYPAWAYDIPMPLYTFLEDYDLSGKTIIPFCTSGGTRIAQTTPTIERLQPYAKVLQGITIGHRQIFASRDILVKWLRLLEY